MLKQDDRESSGVEVRPEEGTPESGGVEEAARPRLFGELGTGITTREVISRASAEDEVAALFHSLLESAKQVGVERKLYLLTATRRALADPKVVTLHGDLAR